MTTKPEDALVELLNKAAVSFTGGQAPLGDVFREAADAITTLLERERRDNSALAEIGAQIAWWLRYTREYGELDRITVDTHIIPPCWPGYGQLCNWLDHLAPELAAEARAALTAQKE